MGIQGLWPLLKDHTKAKHIREYAGKCVAVDTYVWLHKAAFGCCVELATRKDNQLWLRYCFDYIELLLRAGVSVYLVFDGGPLPAKKNEELERRKKRDQAREEGLGLLRAGQTANARAKLSRAVDISPLMAARLIKACKDRYPDVRCLVAPYEADAQLAYLCRAGIVDAVITEDSDAVPYGCGDIITKLDKTGHCQCVSLAEVYSAPSSVDFRNFSPDMMVLMCVAAGCDYLTSLPGIGVKKSYKYISRHRTMHRLLRALRFEGVIPLSEVQPPLAPTPSGPAKLYRYELDFYKAVLTFRHQTVYDPVQRRLRHLSDLPVASGVFGSTDGIDIYKLFLGAGGADALLFLGPMLTASLACDIAEGIRDPETMEPFDFDGRAPSPTSVMDHFNFLSSHPPSTKKLSAEMGLNGSRQSFTKTNNVNENNSLPAAVRFDGVVSSWKRGKKRGLLEFMDHRGSINPSASGEGTGQRSAEANRRVSNRFYGQETTVPAMTTQGEESLSMCQAPHPGDTVASLWIGLNNGVNHDAAWSYERLNTRCSEIVPPSPSPVVTEAICGDEVCNNSRTKVMCSPSRNIHSGADFSHFALEKTPESFTYNVSPEPSHSFPRGVCEVSPYALFATPSGKDRVEDNSFRQFALESMDRIVGLSSTGSLIPHSNGRKP